MFRAESVRLAEQVIDRARARGLTLVTAESVTGGLVAGCLSAVSGASDVLAGGFVAYQASAKTRLLGLEEALLEEHGTVSPGTTRALATGALERAAADLALAVTGYASPGAGVPGDRVGEVHTAVAMAGEVHEDTSYFPGDRAEVRAQAVHSVLGLAAQVIGQS